MARILMSIVFASLVAGCAPSPMMHAREKALAERPFATLGDAYRTAGGYGMEANPEIFKRFTLIEREKVANCMVEAAVMDVPAPDQAIILKGINEQKRSAEFDRLWSEWAPTRMDGTANTERRDEMRKNLKRVCPDLYDRITTR
jgi:hypothetical protein